MQQGGAAFVNREEFMLDDWFFRHGFVERVAMILVAFTFYLVI
jgi:hypothetical protein